MESPFKDLRIRVALAFAAFLLGNAYFAIVYHVLPSKRKLIAEIPPTTGIVVGSIEAVLSVPVLWFAWKVYRGLAGRREPGDS